MDRPTAVTMLELIATHPFLDGLPGAWLERLEPHSRRTAHNATTRLFSAGQPADRFWLIRHGSVSLELNIPGRGDVSIEHITPGSVLGWSWMFPPHRWSYTAVAAEQVFALELNGPGVRHLCEQEPALGYELTRRFAAVLIDRLQAARTRLVELYTPIQPPG